MKKVVSNAIGIIIIVAIVIGIIAVIVVPAGFIMKLFGFEYTSVWSIICFLDTIATVVGLTIVDGIMESVSATDTAIFVVSLILALLNLCTRFVFRLKWKLDTA